MSWKLIIACKRGDIDSAKKLIPKWADVNCRNNYGHTALMSASYYGHIDIIILLLGNGADVSAQDINGWSALTWASSNDRSDVVLLLKAHILNEINL